VNYRWSQLSRVERVDLYTRQSLYLVLWLMCVSMLFAASPAEGGRGAAFWGGGVLVTALGSWVLNAVLGVYPRIDAFPWPRVGVLVVGCAAYLGAAALPTSSPSARGAVALLVVTNLAAAVGGLPDNRIGAAVIVACGAVVGLTGREASSFGVGIGVGLFVVFTVRVSLWLYGVVSELDEARQTQSRLAVAEERLRFSRDVHDVLGRRLSTIAVQAELAATLARRGDERAAAQMMEVRQVAHDALGEARELARGYRPTNLAQEIEGARSLLRSAGIEVELEIGVVPRAWHEAAGWVVRESITNVLRHSTATLVRITHADGCLRVQNDGVSATASESGSGLRGLAERLAPLGGRVDAGREGGQWTVVANLPGPGPVSAGVLKPENPAENRRPG
jgi:two-component system sensor histidine kinase DesK